MPAYNEFTGRALHSGAASQSYLNNYESVFGDKPKIMARMLSISDVEQIIRRDFAGQPVTPLLLVQVKQHLALNYRNQIQDVVLQTAFDNVFAGRVTEDSAAHLGNRNNIPVEYLNG